MAIFADFRIKTFIFGVFVHRFQSFRNTFAIHLTNKGIDIHTISILLGHKQVSSTQSYAKTSPKNMMEALQETL